MKNSILQDIDEVTYMSVKTISTYLGVAKSTIYKWVESGFIPHKKLRKRVLFVKEHIDQWILNDGVIVKDLPEVPKYPEIDNSETTHRLVTYKERPSVQGNFIVKYRSAG